MSGHDTKGSKEKKEANAYLKAVIADLLNVLKCLHLEYTTAIRESRRDTYLMEKVEEAISRAEV